MAAARLAAPTGAARGLRLVPPSRLCDPIAIARAKSRQQALPRLPDSAPARRDANSRLLRRPPLRTRLAFKPPLGGLVVILERDQQALHGTQRPERSEQDQRAPQRGMEPERRLVQRLHDQCAPHHDESRQENDEYRRPIPGIDEGVVKPAHLAMCRQAKKATEQLAFAATRATAHQPGEQRRHRWMGALIRHESLTKTEKGGARRPSLRKR